MLQKCSRAALPLFLSISLPLFAAQKPWEATPFTADPKALVAAAAEVQKEAPAVVLSQETHYVFDASGRKTMTERTVFRISSDSAIEQWSGLSAAYSPWYQEKPILRARVISPDGTVHELDQSTIDDAPAQESESDIYTDNRVVQAPLPAMGKGVVVEEEITIRDKDVFFAAGVTDTVYFASGAPIESARLLIDAPSSLALRIQNRLGASGHESREEKDGVVHLVYEASNLAVPEDLEYSVASDVRQFPYVAFATGKSWNDVAKSYASIVDKQIDDAAAAAMAKSAIGDAKDRATQIARILNKLHQTVRYTGLELGDASIVPRAPSEILKRKYGDCKDKASLLVAMLRGVGIAANVATLRAGYGGDVEAELPGFGEFNHAIVVVRGEPDIWIDATDEFSRAGELPVADQGRLALIADPTTEKLTLTPRFSSKENRSIEQRTFKLKEDGPASIVEVTTSYGSHESAQRHFFAETETKDLKKALEEYAKDAYNTEKLSSYTNDTPADLSKHFTSSLVVDAGKRGITDGPMAAVGIYPPGMLERLPYALRSGESEKGDKTAEKKKRRNDFVINEPYAVEWHYTIEPPMGFRPRELPASEDRVIGPFKLVKKFSADANGVVKADLIFDVDRNRLTPAEYEQVRADIAELDKKPGILINFEQSASALMENGKIKEALAEFRKMAAVHPKEALHRSQLGLALLEAGLGEQARAEARIATQLEPNSAEAQRILGWILQHDLLGRRFHKGFDYAGALAAYRKSKKLDPKDTGTRADLAILLEHDDQGLRYTSRSSTKDAIAEYKELRSELKDEAMNDNLLFALLWTGEFAELRDLARSLPSGASRDAMLIIATAKLEGTDAGFRIADSIVADKDQRRADLVTAATSFLTLRDYKQAAEFFERVSNGAPNAAELAMRARVLKDAKRYDQLTLNDTEPTTVIQKLFIAAGSTDEPKLEQLLPLFSSLLRPEIKDESEMFLRALRGRNASPENDTMRREVLTDIALASIKFTSEGNDATGYRIRPTMTGSKMAEITFFVVKEEGSYRIAGTSLAWSPMALEVKRRIEKNDLDGARQWLDWAREALSGANDDHPFAEHPLVRFWKKGSKGDAAQMKLAAAALLVTGTKEEAKQAVAELVAARAGATPEMQTAIDVALMTGYRRTEEYAPLLEVVNRLQAQRPESDEVFSVASAALTALHRVDEVKTLAEKRLATDTRDAVAIRMLSDLAGFRSDYDGSLSYLKQLIDRGDGSASDYNTAAWIALFRKPFNEESIQQAQKAADLSDGLGNWPILHTLAAVYAEAGKTTEARQVILHEMEVAGSVEPRSEEWYVLGRIAEEYGEKDAAIAAYKRVEKPERDEAAALSTYLLAEKRLKGIAK